ncbi:MAG: Cyclic pyranopterin monophosphate synthase [Candidatus Hydrogenedentes bacterium ADurb.Bin179]|nr:MAG: Cyclic pyranopterin monophosphate synthase [Candidatus Hydrogenedentes bacterium ADurb.Bin179]
MPTLRTTLSLCPQCALEVPGQVILKDNQAFLYRECPQHGASELLLSRQGPLYIDLDRFYFEILKGKSACGRITNYWVLIKNACQMNCSYCSVEMQDPFFEEMSLEEYRALLPTYKKAKHTLTGGEPTLHPNFFQFVEEAVRNRVTVQLATNGVLLADLDYCKRLQDAGIDEVRLSIDSFDCEQAARLGLDKFVEAKIAALHNLEDLNFPTSLSPTIFKGINEDQLVACCEYAKDKPFIRSLSVNGFAYVTTIKTLGPENIIMPDEMMDLLFERYCSGPREDLYTFQKALHALLHLVNIRLCMNVQIMLFVRRNGTLKSLTDYLAMDRMKKSLTRWERHARKSLLWKRLLFLRILLLSIRWKTFGLLPSLMKFFMVNLFGINVKKYPRMFLPVVMNTNCNVYNADKTLGMQCMSGNLFIQNGKMHHGFSTETLSNKEIQHAAERP